MLSRYRQPLLVAARIVFGVTIVWVLVTRADFSGMRLQLDARAASGFVISIGLLFLAMFLSALRWHLVLGRAAPSVMSLSKVYLIGWFFSLFLPTSVGGDAVRAVAVSRSSNRTGAVLSSIVLERLLGVAALGVYLGLGCILAPTILFGAMEGATFSLTPARAAMLAVVAVVGMVGLFLIARRIPKVSALLNDAQQLWQECRRSPLRLGGAFAVSLLVQFVYILVWFDLAWGFRLDVPFLTFLVFVPFVSLAAMLPVTLSGLGVREGAWALLLAPFGIAVADAVTFSLAYYVAGLVLGAVGGLLFMVSGIDLQQTAPPDLPSAAPISVPQQAPGASV